MPQNCAFCGCSMDEADSGAIEINGDLFCTVSCAEEATGQEIKTGYLEISSVDRDGNKNYKYICPYCNKTNRQDEGSSVAMVNGRCITCCAYCGKESITEEKKGFVYKIGVD